MIDTEHRGSIVQRGIDEALACRDMLEPAPAAPSFLSRALARISAAIRVIAPRHEPEQHRRDVMEAPETAR